MTNQTDAAVKKAEAWAKYKNAIAVAAEGSEEYEAIRKPAFSTYRAELKEITN